MRRLAITAPAVAGLVFAATALAVLPAGGAHFAGTTSAARIGKFKDPVSFSVAANRAAVTSFQWGSFGCFGAGGFPPNKNPYTLPGSAAKVKSLALEPGGTFAGTGKFKLSGTPSTATISGKFSKSKGKLRASGSITIRQTSNGQKCGPGTMTFSAAAK